MLPILAFDLAWSGETGWVLYDGSAELCPFVHTGSFVPPKSKNTFDVAVSIYDSVRAIVNHFSSSPFVVAYEITDWHRTLKGKRFAIDYKIERQAQRCLGRAEVALMLATRDITWVQNLIPIGANEAKREFGAMRKDACASLLADEYPYRFERHDKPGSFLYDKLFKCDISDHISDAMVIASVVAKRERQASLIQA